MKITIWSLLTLAALTFTLAAPATASVVIDATGGTYENVFAFSDYQLATVFTAGTGGAITDLKLGLQADTVGATSFSATLRSVGAGNAPIAGDAGILASVTLPFTVTGVGSNTLYDFTSLGDLGAYSLTPGTQYALTFSDTSSTLSLPLLNNSTFDVANSFTVQGLAILTNGTANFEFYTNDAYGSMNIQLSTGASAVPEPSTYALLCISLGVVGYARKKMGKQ